MSAPELIPPDVRSRLRELRLVTRRATGAQGIGAHASRSRGAGLEFAQYRAYEPGDELRQIDWKLYARSDKFFVREAERESPVALWILLDLSASMAQADVARPGYRRLDAAKGIAAALGELALRQGDRFGLAALTAGGAQVLAPAFGARARDQLALTLHRLHAGGTFPDAGALRTLLDRIGANDMVVLLSDCFDERAVALAERLAAARREVIAIQVLTADERDFAFAGGHRFRDPETGEELLADAPALAAEYRRRFADARGALARRMEAAGVRFADLVIDEALDAPLRRLFGRAG